MVKVQQKKKHESKNKVNPGLKAALKKKIDSITPEQKAKIKKIAIAALVVVGAVAITAVGIHVGKALNAKAIANLTKTFAKESAIHDKYNKISKDYAMDFVGRTGYQRLLDMQDRHPGSKQARSIVSNAWNNIERMDQIELSAGRLAKVANNKLKYYQNPGIGIGRKIAAQIFDRAF